MINEINWDFCPSASFLKKRKCASLSKSCANESLKDDFVVVT